MQQSGTGHSLSNWGARFLVLVFLKDPSSGCEINDSRNPLFIENITSDKSPLLQFFLEIRFCGITPGIHLLKNYVLGIFLFCWEILMPEILIRPNGVPSHMQEFSSTDSAVHTLMASNLHRHWAPTIPNGRWVYSTPLKKIRSLGHKTRGRHLKLGTTF